MKAVPKIRFSEFQSEWIKKRIEDIFLFKNGLNKEKEYFGKGTPIINFTDVYNLQGIYKKDILGLVELSDKEKKNFEAKKGDVFFTRTSETIIDIGMSAVLLEDIPDCTFSGFVLRARPYTNDLVDTFKKYCFSTYPIRKEIVTKSSFTTRALTSGKLLNKVEFCFPSSTEEQQKIASFLSAVDDQIRQLTRKKELLEQYKKGVMQQIFRQQIRFRRDDGGEYPGWEKTMFGEVFTRIKRKNTENSENVLTISAQQGLVNQQEYFSKSVAAKDLSGYYLLEEGDFAYNKSYSNGYPYGAIKRLKKYDKGVVSTLYICFKPKQKYDSGFFEFYFDSGIFNHEIHKIAQEGARNHGLLNVSVNDFFNDLLLNVPSIGEQKKIASFLTVIYDKIDQVDQELEKTKAFKKGLLQQMFV
jgi:type I restriction enzyme S subunit